METSTKPESLPRDELRKAKHCARKAQRLAAVMDGASGWMLREEAWRLLTEEADREEIQKHYSLILNLRKVELSERKSMGVNDVPVATKEQMVRELFGAFPPPEPFETTKAQELQQELNEPPETE